MKETIKVYRRKWICYVHYSRQYATDLSWFESREEFDEYYSCEFMEASPEWEEMEIVCEK